MQVTITDLNYSFSGGSYSPLNSKLYVMDSIDALSDDGTATQSTIYSNQNPSEIHEHFTAQNEESGQNIDPHLNLNGQLYENTELSGQQDNLSQNASQNIINAATNTSAGIGINKASLENAINDYNQSYGIENTSPLNFANGGSFIGNSGDFQSAGNNTNISNTSHFEESDMGKCCIINDIDITNNYNDNSVVNINDALISIESFIENNLQSVTELINTLIFDNISNILQDIGLYSFFESLLNFTNNMMDHLNNITDVAFNTVTHTLDITNNIISELLPGDGLGNIEYLLDIDLLLDIDSLYNLDITDLDSTYYSLLDLNLDANVVFELTGILGDIELGLNLDTDKITSHHIIEHISDHVAYKLDFIDEITSVIPKINIIQNEIGYLAAYAPTEEVILDFSTHGVIETVDNFGITNTTNLLFDLGTNLESDINEINNNLNLFENDDNFLEINDLLNINGNETIDSQDGLEQNENITETVSDVIEDATDDIQNILDETSNDNLDLEIEEQVNDLLDEPVENISNNIENIVHEEGNETIEEVIDDVVPEELLEENELENLVNQLAENVSEEVNSENEETSNENNTTENTNNEVEDAADTIYDALATSSDEASNEVEEAINDVDMSVESMTEGVIDVLDDVNTGLFGNNSLF